MATKKRKPLTKAEKAMNKQVRENLREKGLIPPRKKRLNRNQFADDVLAEIERFQEDKEGQFDLFLAIGESVGWMLPTKGSKILVSPEQVGVIKLLKIAVEEHKYVVNRQEQGIKTTYLDIYNDVVKPILDL